MKNVIFFFLLFFATAGLYAQGGNFVISDVKLFDMGDGTGVLTVHVSGNLAYMVTGGTFTASGDAIPGGTASGGMGDMSRVIVTAPTPGQGNGNGNVNPNGNEPVILTGIVPLLPKTNPGPRKVDFWGSIKSERVFYHWGSTVTTSNP